MKKIYILILSILSLSGVQSQVSVTATAGTTGPTTYTTVNAAFTAINAGTHQGIITIALTGNTTEPATAVPLLASATPSNYTKVIIRPSGGNRVINSAASPTLSRGILEFNGADNVLIDGDDPGTSGTRNLTIQAATLATPTGIACVRFSSTSTTGANGADNDTIMNCTIVGARPTATSTTVNYGICMSNSSSITTGAYSSINMAIINNEILRCFTGINCLGASATYPNNGLKIQNNILGSSSASQNIGGKAIFASFTSSSASTNSAIIEGNDLRVGDVSISGSGYSASISGIELGSTTPGTIIRKNNIHDILQPSTGGWGAFGIYLLGTSSNDIEIYNNYIHNIVASKFTATATSSFTAYGIRVGSSGVTNLKVNHNTIILPAASTGTVANYANHAIYFVASSSASQIMNNIIVNRNVGTGSYGIYTAGTSNISTATMDKNDIYCPSGVVGYYNSANRTTLSDWQSSTSQDANSYSVDPPFTSTSNPKLVDGTTSILESGGMGTGTTFITTDIEGDARPGPASSVNGGGTAPDVGADEFDGTPVSCFTPIGLTKNAVTSTSADYSWSAPSPTPSGGYDWELRTSGAAGSGATGLVTSGNTSSLTLSHTGLTANTNYSFYVRSNCGAGITSSWTSSTFYTGYCVAGTVSQASWISNFTSSGGTINMNYSSASGTSGGYSNKSSTDKISNFISAGPTNISLTAGGPTCGFAVWVDWNNNMDFESGERMFVTSAYVTTTSGSITIPSGTANGSYRMRVVVDFNNTAPSSPCGTSIARGEYVDYTFEVVPTPTCFIPTAINTTSVTSTSASLNWTAPASAPAGGYQWEVRSSGAPGSGATGLASSGSVAAGVLTASATGLIAGNPYSIYIRSVCASGDTSTWTGATIFTTNPVTSASSGDWNVASTWATGSVPACGEGVAIAAGHNVTVNSTGNNAKNLIINPGATLTMASGDLTVGCSSNNSYLRDSGTLTVSGGTLNVNGNIYIHTGAAFNQSAGDINIDGNSGQIANSVLTGTNLLQINSNVLNLSGGKITIVDPHAGLSSTDYAIAYNTSALHYASNPAHTIQYGNGTSSDTGGHINGFYNYFFVGTGYFSAGNIIVNAGNAKKRYVNNTSSIGILGNLTITSGEFRTGTGTVYVAGNITNNDTLTTDGTLAFASFTNGVVNNATSPQTVSGSGVYRNATTGATFNFNALTFQNTSSTGTTINSLNNLSGVGSFSGANAATITFNSSGKATTSAGNALLWGRFNARGTTLTVNNGGMTSGSTFAIGTTKTQTGTTITASTDLTSTNGRFPFLNSSNEVRSLFIGRVTPVDSGIMAFTYGQGSGLSTVSMTDGTYNVNTISLDSFQYSTFGTTPNAATYNIALQMNNVFGGILTGDSARILQMGGFVGTYQKGTITPSAQRLGLTSSNLLSGALYMGVNSAQIPFASAQSGDWNVASTWNKGSVPTCTDVVNIAAGHTVTVNSTANVSGPININTGGILTIASGDLTTGCTGNNTFFSIIGGTFNMNGGTFNLNGKFALTGNSNGRFNQSGGSIIVDGNSGVSSTSCPGHIVDMYCHTATGLNLTGGSFTIKDPALSATTTDCAFKVFPSPTGIVCGSSSGWNLNIGNGATGGNRGGNSTGFLINTANSTTAFKISNFNVNMSMDSPNRHVTTSIYHTVHDMNVYKGDLRLNSTTYCTGNITNNDTLSTLSTLNLQSYQGAVISPVTTSQTIGGTGVFRNSTTAVTGNMLSLTINNTDASGVTLNVPIRITSTLNLIRGIVNTTSTNVLGLGTTSASGTLTYTYNDLAYVNGPFERYTAASITPTATSTIITHPVGEGGKAFPLYISPQTSSAGAVLMRGQAFNGTNSGSAGGGVSNLSSNYWSVEPTMSTSGNFLGAFVGVGDTISGGGFSTKKLVFSATNSGTYDPTLNGSSYFATPAPGSLRQSGLIDNLSFLNFFSYADVTPCSPPSSQATINSVSLLTTTTAGLKFSAPAVSPPTGYLVLVDTTSTSINLANLVDGTTYAVGANASLSARVIGNYTTIPAVLTLSGGMVASTNYTVYVIGFNNTGCAGPSYNTISIPSQSFTTCAATISAPTLMTYTNQSSSGFDIGWTASATAGTSTIVDISTNPTFTALVAPYIDSNVGTATSLSIGGLSSGTTYYARIRAQDASGCVSSFVYAYSVATECGTAATTITENFDALPNGTVNTVWPSCWKKVSNIGTAYLNTTNFSSPSSLFLSGSTTVPPTVSLPLVNNATASSHRVRFKLSIATSGASVQFGYLTNPADPATFVSMTSFSTPSTTGFYDVSYGPITAGTNNLAFKAPVSGSIYIDNFNYEIMPSCTIAEAGTASATATTLCLGSSTLLSSTGYTKDSLNLTYVWQTSPDNVTWSNKSAPSIFYGNLIDTPSVNTYYRLKVECSTSGSIIDTTNSVSVVVNSPMVLTTTTDTTCGIGIVNLSATGTDTAFKWYNSISSTTPIATGASFSTTINSDSTFYVSNGAGSPPVGFIGDGDWQHVTTTGGFQSTTITGAYAILTVTSPITLSTFDMYPSAAVGSAFSVEARTGSASGSTFLSYTGTTTVTNSGSPTVAQTVPVNWYLPVGTYYIGFTTNPSTWRSGVVTHSFPWTLNGGGATLDYYLTPSYQYYLFNLQVGSGCFSAKTPVVAKYNVPPSVTATASTSSLCLGLSDTLTASSTNTGYTYAWSNSLGSGTTKIVTPTFHTTYSVTATDNSGGANQGCVAIASVPVTILPSPSAMTLSQGVIGSICSGAVDSVVVTGGFIPTNGTQGTGTTAPSSTGAPNTLSAYYGGSKYQLLFTKAELNALGFIAGSSITKVGQEIDAFTSAALTKFTIRMKHTTATTLSTIQTGMTQVYDSTTFTPSATGWADFTLHTPFVWNGTNNLIVEFVYNGGNGGNGLGTTTRYTSTTSNMTTYLRTDNVAGGIAGFDALTTSPTATLNRPNTKFEFSIPNITWTPTTGLYTNKAATTAYTGGSAQVLYMKNTSNQKYYATSTTGTCTKVDSIVDSVNIASNLISLASSSSTGCVPQCTDASGFTFYASPSNPSQLIFGIDKGSSGMTGETINIEVLSSNPINTAVKGPNEEHSSYLMKRGWDVTGTVPSGSVTVRFFYDPQDSITTDSLRNVAYDTLKYGLPANGGNSSTLAVKSPFEWFKSNGVPYNAAWRSSVVGNKFPASHVKLTPSGYGVINGVHYVDFAGITSFSGGTGGSGFGAPGGGGGVGLPVTWAGFDVKVTESGNQLTWKTASEKNTDYFNVEYSYDATNFINNEVKIAAAGNSADMRTYYATHSDFSPYVYYRIKQVDLDGRVDYSVTKLAKRTTQSTFNVSVYPIPMNNDNVVNVKVSSIDKSKLTITLTDITGKVIRSKSLNPVSDRAEESYDMSPLTNGVYFIEVQNGQGKETIKISK